MKMRLVVYQEVHLYWLVLPVLANLSAPASASVLVKGLV